MGSDGERPYSARWQESERVHSAITRFENATRLGLPRTLPDETSA